MTAGKASEVFCVRIHGRGGQGVVTAAEILSVAAFLDGRHAQAIPSFGSERMGAPVVSYCRIDDRPIRRHDPVEVVDAVVIQDPTLLHELDLFAGLAQQGCVLINSARSPADLGLDELEGRMGPRRLVTVAATEVAVRATGRPMPNVALLGALAQITGVVPLDALAEAITRRFSALAAEGNRVAAAEAARLVRASDEEEIGAGAA